MSLVSFSSASFSRVLAALVFFLAATLGVWRGGSFAALALAGGLLFFLEGLAHKRCLRPARRPTLFVLCALTCLLALAPFAAHSSLAFHETLRLASIFIPLLFWSDPALLDQIAGARFWRFWPWVLLCGLFSVAFALAFTRLQGDIRFLTKLNRGVSYAFLLVWPAAAFLRGKGKGGLALFLCALVPALLLTHSRAAQTGTVFGLFCFFAASLSPFLTAFVFATLAPLLFLWPYAARFFFALEPDLVARLPDSWRARVEIWDYFSFRIEDHPWLGNGLGSSPLLPFSEPHGASYVFTKIPAAHPHNMPTQLWSELGAFGIILGLCFLWGILRSIRALPSSLIPFAFGAFGSALILALSAYDFWTDSLLSAFALVALAFAVLSRRASLN